MSHQQQHFLSLFLSVLGIVLLLGGGAIWAQQMRAQVIEAQEIRLAEATYAPPTWQLVKASPTATSTPYPPVAAPSPSPSPSPSLTALIVSEPITPSIEPSNTPLPTHTIAPSPTTAPIVSKPITPSIEPSNTPLPTHTIAPSPTLSRRATSSANLGSPTPSATSSPTPTVTPELFPSAKSVPSRILAPTIGLDSKVVEMGWEVKYDNEGKPESSWVVPEFAAGWHKNSSLPGHGGNTVLSAHNNIGGEVFRDLANLEAGHEIEVEADGIAYHYVVEEKYIVKEEGESLEVRHQNNRFLDKRTPDERLTLVSCWPYQTNSHRVIVIARPVLSSTLSDFGPSPQ